MPKVTNKVRVIKSRFRDAAAKIATESQNSGQNNSGHKSIGADLSNNLANSGSIPTKPLVKPKQSSIKAPLSNSYSRPIARNRVFASSLTLSKRPEAGSKLTLNKSSSNSNISSSGSNNSGVSVASPCRPSLIKKSDIVSKNARTPTRTKTFSNTHSRDTVKLTVPRG